MPNIDATVFKDLALMAGTARSFEQTPVGNDEKALFDRDFTMLCDVLSKTADPTIGENLRSEYNFYMAQLQVAKGYFDNKPFGGLKAATGQFGFRILAPQDLKQASSAQTPAYYSWAQTLTTTSVKTRVQYAIGYSSGNVYASNQANTRAVLGFHTLLSYKPDPKVMYAEWNINSYPYVPYSIEPFSQVGRPEQLFKFLPMPGRIIIHPGGGFYLGLYFDLRTGASTPTGTSNIDTEIALFGLVFGEYDYLQTSNIT